MTEISLIVTLNNQFTLPYLTLIFHHVHGFNFKTIVVPDIMELHMYTYYLVLGSSTRCRFSVQRYTSLHA